MPTNPSLMSGVSELLLLNLLAEREMYGYELARAIRVVTKEAISVGESVLYPALHTLERRGWLTNDAVNFLSTLSALAATWIGVALYAAVYGSI